MVFVGVSVLEWDSCIFGGGSQVLGGGGREIKEEPKSRGDPSGFCRVPVLEGNLLGGVPGIEGGTEVVLGAGAVGGGPTLTVCSRMAALVSRKPRATWGKI